MYATETNYLRNLRKSQYGILMDIFHIAKNLYSKGLYEARQPYIRHGVLLTYEKLYEICKSNENYSLLAAQGSQQILKRVTEVMKSHDALKHLEGYMKPVRLPGYLEKDGVTGITFPAQAISVTDGVFKIPISRAYAKEHPGEDLDIYVPFPKNLDPAALKEVTIYPVGEGRAIKIAYTYNVTPTPSGNGTTNVLGIDLGLDNFASCVSTTGTSFILDGRYMKSINQLYNKTMAAQKSIDAKNGITGLTDRRFCLQEKRNNMINDIIYKHAKFVIGFCLANNIGTIVVGYNKGQKQGISMGKKNNQHFVSIPYWRFRHQLGFLCAKNGITFIEGEESYTSKSSFLDLDAIPTWGQEKDKVSFSGKRVHRGLYRSGNGTLVNADLNGAANIIRKHIPEVTSDSRFMRLGRALKAFPKRVRFKDIEKKGLPDALSLIGVSATSM